LPEVSFERSVFIQHELARIGAGKAMEPLDEARCVRSIWLRLGGVCWWMRWSDGSWPAAKSIEQPSA